MKEQEIKSVLSKINAGTNEKLIKELGKENNSESYITSFNLNF